MLVRIVDESDPTRIIEVEDVEVDEKLAAVSRDNGGLIPVKSDVFDAVRNVRGLVDRANKLGDQPFPNTLDMHNLWYEIQNLLRKATQTDEKSQEW